MEHPDMSLVHLAIIAVFVQYLWFGWQVSLARRRYQIAAPATSGHPEFERTFRVHQNTLEALVVLVPSMMICAHEFDARLAAACGVLFIVGRALYAREYLGNPKTRTPGYALCAAATLTAMLGGAWGALRHYL